MKNYRRLRATCSTCRMLRFRKRTKCSWDNIKGMYRGKVCLRPPSISLQVYRARSYFCRIQTATGVSAWKSQRGSCGCKRWHFEARIQPSGPIHLFRHRRPWERWNRSSFQSAALVIGWRSAGDGLRDTADHKVALSGSDNHPEYTITRTSEVPSPNADRENFRSRLVGYQGTLSARILVMICTNSIYYVVVSPKDIKTS